EYKEHVLSIRTNTEMKRDDLLRELVDIQYPRNDIDVKRGSFRVRGDSVEIIPASREQQSLRVEFVVDEIDRIREVDALTGDIIGDSEHVAILPASHIVTSKDNM